MTHWSSETMSGILTIAHLTFHEARRRKILLAASLLGLAFLALYGTGFWFMYQNVSAQPRMSETQRSIVLNFVVMAGLYAVNFLTIMAAILLPVDTMAGEIDSGVMQSLATKPLRRSEILLGKWLGFLAVMGLYLVAMTGGVLAIARVISGFTPPGIHIGVPLILLEGTLLMTVSIAGGTRLSTLANGVLCFGLYGLGFIGGWLEQIGTRFGSQTTRNTGIISSLIVPTESLWQLAAYNMQGSLMRQLSLTPFSPASVPSSAMVVWAAGYILATLGIALFLLKTRDL